MTLDTSTSRLPGAAALPEHGRGGRGLLPLAAPVRLSAAEALARVRAAPDRHARARGDRGRRVSGKTRRAFRGDPSPRRRVASVSRATGVASA